MEKLVITENDIPVGEQIQWPIFDENDRMLLKKGVIISSKRQVDSLLMRGAYYINESYGSNTTIPNNPTEIEETSEEENATAFERLHSIIAKLNRLFAALGKEIPPQNTEARTKAIAKDLQETFQEYPDAMLGAVHLVHEYEYTVIHPIHVAILAEMIGASKGVAKEDRISTICAAFTQNFSMNELQEDLQRQKTGLTKNQLEEIKTHPIRSARLLKSAGVTDKIWLRTVLQHHEKIDASGYPAGVIGEKICVGAKILSICDTYAAMVSSKAHRDSMSPNNVLKELFLAKGTHCDEDLSLIFIRELGVYPPGAFVNLVNGETAVIIGRGKQILHPTVSAYISPRGSSYPKPYKRDCSLKPYAIKGICQADTSINMNLSKIWFFT